MHMTGKYSWNINRVDVEFDRGSKVFKMRDVQGYPRAPKTVGYIFNPRLLKTQTTIAINNFLITVVHISLLLKIR